MLIRVSLLTVACALLMACGGGKFSKMSNEELVAKSDECNQKKPTSPGRATACENVRKECEKRRKDGNWAC